MKKTTIFLIAILTALCLTCTAQSLGTSSVKHELKVHFIDVGQGDSILIQGDANMLIDAGNDNINYLKELKIKKLDYVIVTHPHADHIAGMAQVIKTFDIGKIYMPKVTTNTRAFENLLTEIKNKNLKISTPVPNTTFTLGQATTCTILAPNSQYYSNLNDYSIVLKLTYGKTSFLFEGDAGIEPENEMLSKNYNLAADVLKVGHHGSSYSSSIAFLNKVKPKYAVISVGKGNIYGHPARSTLDKLYKINAQIFRTDENGTITATTDGDTIKFDKKASAIKPQAPPISTIVFVTKTGTKYHRDGCRYLSKSKIPISLSKAVSQGYTPCSVCNPPT